MADLPPAAVTLTPDLDALLLDTKLTTPLPRAGLVSRSATIARARESRRRVVAVSAPAGYGKTSLLAEWAVDEERPVAWVSLDQYDDDPAAVLALLSTAYVRAVGGDEGLVADMSTHGSSVLGRAAPRLASSLRASPTPFVIMLDDLHELRSPATHDVLSVIIGGIPDGSLLVAASRHEQPHVPWLRASADVFELGIEDLALDPAEAVQVFATAHVELPAELAAIVVDRTEGWPVGVHLAAVVARESPDAAATVSGDDPYVTDYLYREALGTLPEDTQRFLRRTAVLDRLSAELCDSLLEESNSQSVLRELEATNAFLIALDRRRAWYRYHSLFREFLLGELRRTEPEIVEELHTRAADWYERNASGSNAVEHVLQTADRTRGARLVSVLARPVYESGQVATLGRWLDVIGNRAIAGYPPLAVLAGWFMALTGQSRDAERWAAVIEAAAFDEKPEDGTASFESGRSMLRSFMVPSGPERARADAEFAFAAEPSWSPWRDLALAVLGEALLLTGEHDAAAERFAEASRLAIASGNHEIRAIVEAELAILAMERRAWDDADAHARIARAEIEENRLFDYAAASLAYPAAARIALHRGDRKTAEREIRLAMRVRPFATYALPALAVRLRLQTAVAHVAMGDPATARHLAREIEDVLARRPQLGALVDAFEQFRELLDGTTAEQLSGPPLTPAELRLLPYLQTHLTYPEIGARLFVSRNTVSTEVSAIYRKLGVSSRTDAVTRATAMGLLGG